MMSLALTTEQIARVCYEANRAYCMANGDHGQVPWDSAPAWQRSSYADGVDALLANPNLTPEDQHEAWRTARAKQGWMYGPKKIPEQNLHPCMVPYADLPPMQQAKDDLFQGVARSLLQLEQEPAPAQAPVNPPPDEDPKPTTSKKKTKRSKRKKKGADTPPADG